MASSQDTRPEGFDDVFLEVGGQSFRNWTSVSITRSIEAATGSFELSYAEDPREVGAAAVGHAAVPRAKPQDRVAIRVGRELVMEGRVDSLRATLDGRSRSFTISGRDTTADLVDCSVLHDPGEWKKLNALELAIEIAGPFGIDVTQNLSAADLHGPGERLPVPPSFNDPFFVERFARAAAAGDPFDTFKLQPGESCWQAIERACRLRGLLCYSQASRNGTELVIAAPGQTTAIAALVEGVNVRSAELNYLTGDQFSLYIVRGQSPGSDFAFGSAVSQIEGRASDLSMKRYRPLIVLAEGALTFENAADRAQWEATVRAARASAVTVSVQGWRQTRSGRLWAINELVPVKIPSLNLDSQLLAREVTFQRSESGTTTSIDLVRADAYTRQPEIPKDSGFSSFSGGDEPEEGEIEGAGQLLIEAP